MGKESSLGRRPAVQPLELLGYRLGAHVDRRDMVQGDAACAGVSPAGSLVGRSRSRVRRQYSDDAPAYYFAGALADDPGGFSSQFHPRTAIVQHGAAARNACQDLCLLDSNLRLSAAGAPSLW